MKDYTELINAAVDARERSYSPYSNFMVGAALLTKSGKIYTGANIENAAYTPSNCAERTAFFSAVFAGEREFEAIAVAGWAKGGTPGFAYPCGVCRQVMTEFCDPEAFTVIVTNGKVSENNKFVIHSLAELLPFGFGPSDLE
ncbi:cytidine deaminase [Clostridia bacterium]|nr:cytidine deaminase [Clostridia bacterium]